MVMQRVLGSLIAAGLLVTPAAWAESPVTAGDYQIYYNTSTAATLDPEIAKTHGIQRSKLNGLLNVTVLKSAADGQRENVPARVETAVRTGEGPTSPIAMREIRVGDGVSYLGQFPIQDEQIIDFAIQVKPPGAEQMTTIELREQFFTD